jgi:two-component system cell cycle response regulator
VHYEVTVESFRQEAANLGENVRVSIVDAGTGRVVIDSTVPQEMDARLGRGRDPLFAGFMGTGPTAGLTEVDGGLAAFQRLPVTPDNANRWVVVVEPLSPPSMLGLVGLAPLAMLLAALVLLVVGVTGYRSAQRELRLAATTDILTGLGNRRLMVDDLDAAFGRAAKGEEIRLALFDLDGFKVYNDTYGHPAGDALLTRLGRKLDATVQGHGVAYRMGGDEFCVLLNGGPGSEETLVAATIALSERGEGFSVTASRGVVDLPGEASEPSDALRLADTRMYASKFSRRPSPERQSRDVLLMALHERYPDLKHHLEDVADLSGRVGARLGLQGRQLEIVRRAAELHDVGKVAIPDSILRKPGPLDEEEWAFMQRHPVIGERILDAAPSLAEEARLVRAHHERYDGQGYPSGLKGNDIPLGARVVAVCDAYHAMVAGRPYKAAMSHDAAMAELKRCAGTQFDPQVVDAFVECLAEPPAVAAHIAAT